MKAILVGLGLAYATCAGAAANWVCDRNAEVVNPGVYWVASRCHATGSYSATGDVMGSGGTNVQLCASAHRQIKGAVLSNAEGGGKAYVATWNHDTAHIMLWTAATPAGPDVPLAEVAAGTDVAGVTFYVLAFCQ